MARQGRVRTAIESGEDPWLLGVKVNSLDTLAASVQLALCLQSKSASLVLIPVDRSSLRGGRRNEFLGCGVPSQPRASILMRVLTLTSNFIVAVLRDLSRESLPAHRLTQGGVESAVVGFRCRQCHQAQCRSVRRRDATRCSREMQVRGWAGEELAHRARCELCSSRGSSCLAQRMGEGEVR